MNSDFGVVTPSTSGLDPQLAAILQSMIEERMREVTETHAQELAVRDIQMEALQNRLSLVGVNGNSGYPTNPALPLVDEDTPMSLQVASILPPSSSSEVPKKKSRDSHRRNINPKSSPGRQSSRLASKKAQGAASTSQVSPLPSQISVPVIPTDHAPPRLPVEVPPIRILEKPGARKFQLTMKELPKDTAGILTAFRLHIRLLSGQFDPKDVFQDPPQEVLDAFHRQCTSIDQIYQFRNPHSRPLVPPAEVKIGTAAALSKGGKLAAQIHLVEQHLLDYMHAYIARFGLLRWCPDFRLSPYSPYNAACRVIAMDTFRQAVISHAYDHVCPNRWYIEDMDLLIKIYDHIVHHAHFKCWKAEVQNPGVVRVTDENSPAYHGRQRLAKSRLDFLIANGYPQRYRDLISVKATSDDEADPTGLKIKRRNVYWIKRRPERSLEAELFIRRLDEAREAQAGVDGKRLTQERIRLVPQETQKDTVFLAVASDMPIDYFAPTFFNAQQPRTRKRIALLKISLLPDVSQSFTRQGKRDEKLSDSAFMDKYGSSVLEKYDLDDLDDADETEFLDDDEDMDIDDDESEYMTGVVAENEEISLQEMTTRSRLVEHLSEESV